MIEELVVNGCSYMEVYAGGGGQDDLAKGLGIPSAKSLAIGGSPNSRILRTTLKHSYLTTKPTLYIIGLTFISRLELPILRDDGTTFEGPWINPQNQDYADKWEHFWTKKDSERFIEIKLKSEAYSTVPRLEDLMYRILSTINDLQSRGHKVLVFQQSDDSYQRFADDPRLNLLYSTKNIIDGLMWRAILYQHGNNVPNADHGGTGNYLGPRLVAEEMKHRAPGEHKVLNDFLINYIRGNDIL